MKVLTIWDDVTGVEYHRLMKPLLRIEVEAKANDGPFRVDLCENPKENGLGNLHNYDLILFNRHLGHMHLEVLRYMAEHKIKYIVDIDDYWKLPKHHPAQKHYKEHGLSKAIEEAIKYADGVTVSTEELAAYIRPLNRKLCILPNALDETDAQWNHPRPGHEGIRIGYMAGITHYNDAQIVGPALSHIQNMEADVKVVYAGFNPRQDLSQSILKRLNNNEKAMRVGYILALTPDKYGMMLSNLDIMIAPLEDTAYNRCKSDIKVLEAHAYGIPIVCSDVGPYKDHRFTHGVFIAEDNSQEAWVDAMTKAIAWHRSKGAEDHVPIDSRRDLAEINAKRMEFYERIAAGNVNIPL